MGGSSRIKGTPRRIRTAEREAAGLDLRKAGATYDVIAQRVGYADRSAVARFLAP